MSQNATARPRSAAPVPDYATHADIVTVCKVSHRTARRWKRRGYMPAGLAALVAAALGDLGVIHRAWRGWRIGPDGRLYGQLESGFLPGEINAIPFHCMMISNYQRELRGPRQADLLSDRWSKPAVYVPDDAPAFSAVSFF